MAMTQGIGFVTEGTPSNGGGEIVRSRSGLLASVSRQAWERHETSPGRLPAFPARDATGEEGLYSLYRDFLWLALSWAKAGEYRMTLSFAQDGAVGSGRCAVVAFGGRGHACVRGCDDAILEEARQAIFSFAAQDGFATDYRKSAVSWLTDGDYRCGKAGAFVKKPQKRELCRGLVGVDSSSAARTGA